MLMVRMSVGLGVDSGPMRQRQLYVDVVESNGDKLSNEVIL